MINLGPFSIQIVIILSAVFLASVTVRNVARGLPDSSHKLAIAALLDAAF